jgi:type II secretory pathway pseudopilin PulG
MYGRNGSQGRGTGLANKKASGFTLVEIGMAMTVLLVALMAMGASTLRMSSLRRQNRERALAQNAIRLISEQLHATADEVRRAGGDWSPEFIAEISPGGSLGNEFAIRGLNPQADTTTVGTIEVMVDETASDAETGFELGMPRDLDGDGQILSSDVSANARILPVVVRVQWRGISGNVQIVHPFYVIGY